LGVYLEPLWFRFMVVYSIIQKSQLEGALRLDAEYYQPEYLDVKDELNRIGRVQLSKLTEFVRCGPFGSNLLCETYTPDGVTVIRPFNLIGLTANSGELVSISRSDCVRQSLHFYRNGDVFFARVGDVRFGIAEGFDGDVTISPNIIAVRAKSDLLDPYFLVAFLGSQYGYLQVERGLKIVAQPTIQTSDVKTIAIPAVSMEGQRVIGQRVSDSFQAKRRAAALYSQTETLLLEELGLAEEKFEDELTYVVDSEKVDEANRTDADYFQPKYEKLIAGLKDQDAKPLETLVTIRKGVEPGSGAYRGEGKPFIRVSNLTKEGLTNNNQQYLGKNLYHSLKGKFEPRIGEVLLTKDATPGVAYVVKEPTEGIVSGGILRLKVKDNIDPEYLALCLNSIVGKLQVKRAIAGSVIAHWRPRQIKETLIPILPKSTRQKIADLVRQSHSARKESKQLLEKAKQKVEELIEKGDE